MHLRTLGGCHYRGHSRSSGPVELARALGGPHPVSSGRCLACEPESWRPDKLRQRKDPARHGLWNPPLTVRFLGFQGGDNAGLHQALPAKKAAFLQEEQATGVDLLTVSENVGVLAGIPNHPFLS